MFRSLPVLICCRMFLCVGRCRSPLAGQSGVSILRDKHWRGSVISMLDVCAGKSQRRAKMPLTSVCDGGPPGPPDSPPGCPHNVRSSRCC